MMKKTFTNIFTMAALLMAGAAFTACSSSDDTIEQKPAAPGKQVYTLTINASKDSKASTRALALDGEEKLVAKWAYGDKLTVSKGTTNLGTLSVKEGSISDDGQSATFEGTVEGDVTTDDVLMLGYHYDESLSPFSNQKGTLSGANGAESYDMAIASIGVKSVSGETIELDNEEVTFFTLTSMIKLTLRDDAGTPINAKSLSVTANLGAGNEQLLGVTIPSSTYTANSDGILYFALPSAATVAVKMAEKYGEPMTVETAEALLNYATITFTASDGTNTYICKKKGYKFVPGNYYNATLTMAEPLTYPIALSEVTSGYVGSVVTTDGMVYATVNAATEADKTAAALIAYVSETGHGLALALADDADLIEWEPAVAAAAAHTPALAGSAWRLPEQDEWRLMFNANGGVEDNHIGLDAAITAAGGSPLSAGYWTATELVSGYPLDVYILAGGLVLYGQDPEGNTFSARACFTF